QPDLRRAQRRWRGRRCHDRVRRFPRRLGLAAAVPRADPLQRRGGPVARVATDHEPDNQRRPRSGHICARRREVTRLLAAPLVALAAMSPSGGRDGYPDVAPAAAWPQWGGPNRNFAVPAVDLATAWPAGGPRRLWQRPLGDGFSSIVTDGTSLYT